MRAIASATAKLSGMQPANLPRWSADLDSGAIHVVHWPQAGEFTNSREKRRIPMHAVVRQELTAMRVVVPAVVVERRALSRPAHVFARPAGQA